MPRRGQCRISSRRKASTSCSKLGPLKKSTTAAREALYASGGQETRSVRGISLDTMTKVETRERERGRGLRYRIPPGVRRSTWVVLVCVYGISGFGGVLGAALSGRSSSFWRRYLRHHRPSGVYSFDTGPSSVARFGARGSESASASGRSCRRTEAKGHCATGDARIGRRTPGIPRAHRSSCADPSV
jgi:hypothetical protein